MSFSVALRKLRRDPDNAGILSTPGYINPVVLTDSTRTTPTTWTTTTPQTTKFPRTRTTSRGSSASKDGGCGESGRRNGRKLEESDRSR